MLINRVADTDVRWHQEVTTAAPRVTPAIDLVLDEAPIKRAIDNLSLIKIRCEYLRIRRVCRSIKNQIHFYNSHKRQR